MQLVRIAAKGAEARLAGKPCCPPYPYGHGGIRGIQLQRNKAWLDGWRAQHREILERGGPTYRAYTWDHEANRGRGAWDNPPRYQGVTKWGLRQVIRDLRAGGWSNVSVLIEREDA